MAVSRPLLIVLVGAVLVAGAFLVTRAMGPGDSSSPDATPSATEAAPDGEANPAAETAEPPAVDGDSRVGGNPPANGNRQAADETPTGGLPRDVERALDQGKVVVVTLFDRGAADDVLTGRNLLAVSRRPGTGSRQAKQVRVFPDFLSNVSSYMGLTQALQITRAPAAIIIDEQRRARVVQGFTDASSLRQHVADALERSSRRGG